MKWNEIITEFADSQSRMIFGRSVPDKGVGLEADMAVFASEDNRQVGIVWDNNQFVVFNREVPIFKSGDAQAVESKLTKYRLTNFLGLQHFGPDNG